MRVSWVTIAMTTIAVCLAAPCDKLNVTVGAVYFEGNPEKLLLTAMSRNLPARWKGTKLNWSGGCLIACSGKSRNEMWWLMGGGRLMEVGVDTWTLDSGWKERGGPNTCAWAMGASPSAGPRARTTWLLGHGKHAVCSAAAVAASMFLPYWPTIAKGLFHIVMQEPPSLPHVKFYPPTAKLLHFQFFIFFWTCLEYFKSFLKFSLLYILVCLDTKFLETQLSGIVSGLLFRVS